MKVFWRICTLVDFVAIVIIICTDFADHLIGKILLAVFAALAVSALLKVVGQRGDEE